MTDAHVAALKVALEANQAECADLKKVINGLVARLAVLERDADCSRTRPASVRATASPTAKQIWTQKKTFIGVSDGKGGVSYNAAASEALGRTVLDLNFSHPFTSLAWHGEVTDVPYDLEVFAVPPPDGDKADLDVFRSEWEPLRLGLGYLPSYDGEAEWVTVGTCDSYGKTGGLRLDDKNATLVRARETMSMWRDHIVPLTDGQGLPNFFPTARFDKVRLVLPAGVDRHGAANGSVTIETVNVYSEDNGLFYHSF